MKKYQARVIEDPHDPNLRWLRVSHNGNSYSTIRIDSDDEILQMISALQQSLHTDAGESADLQAFSNASAESTSQAVA